MTTVVRIPMHGRKLDQYHSHDNFNNQFKYFALFECNSHVNSWSNNPWKRNPFDRDIKERGGGGGEKKKKSHKKKGKTTQKKND